MRPHRRQPTRLPRPWDSPGKNTGVGCHFLLQCMKVKSESEVVQSCPTLSDPMDCHLPGSSVHGIFQARVLEWVAIAFSDWLARKRHLMWNQSTKQGVEEKKRNKVRVKKDLNPNPSSFTLWPRATLSWSLSFFICKTGTLTPTSESACCKQSAVNCNCFPFLSFFSKAHGKNHDQ